MRVNTAWASCFRKFLNQMYFFAVLWFACLCIEYDLSSVNAQANSSEAGQGSEKVPALGPDGLGREDEPAICRNRELIKVFRELRVACTPEGCDQGAIERMNKHVDRDMLLGALSSHRLRPIHAFFETNQSSQNSIFDWDTAIQGRLASLRVLDDPDNTVIFLIGKASSVGGSDHNWELSRLRVEGIYKFIKEELKVDCREITVGYLGEDALQFSAGDAYQMGISAASYRGSEQLLNQAVHIFAFPCADRLK